MKKIFLLSIYVFSLLTARADSGTIIIINNTTNRFVLFEHTINNGGLKPPIENPVIESNGGVFRLYTGNCSPFCGVDGFLSFTADVQGKKYLIQLNFNIPYIGGNGYTCTADEPFSLSQITDGKGSHPTITFEIRGSINIPPPPPPVEIPTTGSRTISGSFLWDENNTGMPVLNGADLVSQTFELTAKAPEQLRRKSDNSGESNYAGFTGYFYGSRKVGYVTWKTGDATFAGKKIINYLITNLPDNVPIQVFAETVTEWQPGVNAAAGPAATNPSKYVAIIKENIKTQNTLSYTVYGGWVVDLGNGKSSGATSEIQALMTQVKDNILKQGEDITLGNIFMKSENRFNGKSIIKTGNINNSTIIINNKQAEENQLNKNQIKTNTPLKTTTPSQQKTNVQQKVQVKNGG